MLSLPPLTENPQINPPAAILIEPPSTVARPALEGVTEEVPPESAHGNRQVLDVVRCAGAPVSFDSLPREACNPESINEQLNDMVGQLESTISGGDDMTGWACSLNVL